MNRADLNVLLVMAHSGAVMGGAHHITTWVSEDRGRARVTVHFPLRQARSTEDAYRLLDDMARSAGETVLGATVVTPDGVTGEARRGDAVAELVVMTGSGVRAIAAAIPQPRDGEVEEIDEGLDDAPDRTSVLVDGADT